MFAALRNTVLGLLLAAAMLAGSGVSQATSGAQTIVGDYETTNPIYPMIGADVGVVLYDLAGEIWRDYAFVPAPESQAIGTLDGDITRGSYSIELPANPAGTLLDFDGDDTTPPGVQVYATGLYLNFLGDHMINRGEALLQASVELEPLSQDMIGGHVVVWAADEGEQFPAGLGPDGAAFTEDDPLMPLPAGWSVVALGEGTFEVIQEPVVQVPIVESLGALNDYSNLDYRPAWEQFFARVRETYPFSDEKAIDWDAIYDEITPLIDMAEDDLSFHLIITRFGEMLADTHVGYVSVPILQNLLIGGIGVSGLALTDDGDVVVTNVRSNGPAARAGLAAGDVLIEVDGVPAAQALAETPLLFNSASTEHNRTVFQAITLLQGRVGSTVRLLWAGEDGEHDVTFVRQPDATALLESLGALGRTGRVVSGRVLDSGLGYIRVRSFAEEVSDAAQLFADTVQEMIDADVPGIILDVRANTGGMPQLAMAMAGHFFTDYERVIDFYYADGEGNFDYRGFVEILVSEPYFDGPVAVLVDPLTGSAGDVFVYAMQLNNRAIVVGHTPTGGFTGEVSDGQYLLPGDLTVQVPTGRPADPVTGETVLEGVGVSPDVRVPLTRESVLSPEDEVLEAADQALMAVVAGR